MSRRRRLRGLWSFCLGLILAASGLTQAAAEITRGPIPAQVKQIDGYPFPTKIAGLERGQKTDYNTPGLGFSVRYEIRGETWADIFIYDLGEDPSSEDARELAIEQRDIALGDINSAYKAGSYQDVKLIAKTDTPPYAKAHLTITQRGVTRDSFVFVTVDKKNFVKIRFTSSAKDAARMADQFATEYARQLNR